MKARPRIIEDAGPGFEYDSTKIWALELPGKSIPVDDLLWHFSVPFLDSEGTDDWNLTPQEVLDNPEKQPTHYKQVQAADLSYPIEIMEYNGKWRVLDGLHRLMKAYSLGQKNINVRIIPPEKISEILKSISILGVKINLADKQAALTIAKTFLHSSKSNLIFTPNPEMLVEATRNPGFKNILNQGDLNLCDGFGLKLVAPQLTRISGADFMLDVCGLAEQEQKSIYLLGSGSDETLKKAVENLQQKFPRLKIAGTDSGYTIELVKTDQGDALQCNQDERAETLHRIIMSAPDILFVAFGHNKQESWMVENIDQLPSVKIAMGVGGTIDYLGEKIIRAPKFVRTIGLEWLWRLAREPRRIKRIWNATVVFLYHYLSKKI